MIAVGVSTLSQVYPAACLPRDRVPRLIFLKAPNLYERFSKFGNRTESRRYECHANSQNSSTGHLQNDDASRGKIGYNDNDVTVTAEIEERDDMKKRIESIKSMMRSISDGEVSVSAYDTAWVALVPRIDGSSGPQFPQSLKWIEENQLPDGSWGDSEFFNTQDRLLNTLASVIALNTWAVSPEKCSTGISFLSSYMGKLKEEDLDGMLTGFELTFPRLLEMARSINLDIPFDLRVLEEVLEWKALKLKRIPRDVLHQVPTTLLFSLESMQGLDWEKLLRLQSADGSFLTSPSATAFALMCTGDGKCLDYLQSVVQRFNGGVPHSYPLDIFERLWVVDRLERLGVSRHFCDEIYDCLDYVYKYWTQDAISWSRVCNVKDMDNTSTGFRHLRLWGYDVKPGSCNGFH